MVNISWVAEAGMHGDLKEREMERHRFRMGLRLIMVVGGVKAHQADYQYGL